VLRLLNCAWIRKPGEAVQLTAGFVYRCQFKGKGQSISCLQDWVAECAADGDMPIGLLRLLQGLRSTGAAHARGSGWNRTLARAGVNGFGLDQLFTRVLTLTTEALNGPADLAEQRSPRNP
jgi:hypothetical protein